MGIHARANIALFFSVIGLFVTFFYKDSCFFGGVLFHGFLAAVIGGLSDWFAVKAVFGKPLGIGYRTDILRKNRNRILGELTNFIADDLISAENILNVIKKQNITKMFFDYLYTRGGKDKIIEAVGKEFHSYLLSLEVKRISIQIEPVIKAMMATLNVGRYCNDVILNLKDSKMIEKVKEEVSRFLKSLLLRKDFGEIIKDNVREWRINYEGSSFARKLAFQTLSLTDEKLANILIEKLLIEINEIGNPYSKNSMCVEKLLISKIDEITNNKIIEKKVTAFRDEIFEDVVLQDKIEMFLNYYLNGEENTKQVEKIKRIIGEKIDDFSSNKELQEKVAFGIDEFFVSEIKKYQPLIRTLVEEKVAMFSDDMLVAFVEEKVAADLQAIRINGAVIGSLVGMLLFSVTRIIERMFMP